MPSGAGRDRLAAAAAPAEPFADLGDNQGLGSWSTLTSVERPQLAHDAVTERTPFKRMLARVIGSKSASEFILDFCDRDSLDLTPLSVRSGRCWAASWTASERCFW